LDVYLEIGAKRVFAGALDWPGWCRAGRDEESALQALLDYAPRYARIARELNAPQSVNGFKVVERLTGDATTDFGAPGQVPASDRQSLDEEDLERWLDLLGRSWAAFEAAVKNAQGKQLAKGKQLATGPRGGGRSVDAIAEHVRGAHESYARKVGGQADFVQALLARRRGEVPEVGPRGGVRWPPRYAIRRAAWHILDHAWEIDDRAGLVDS
jgi:hypothetical protein